MKRLPLTQTAFPCDVVFHWRKEGFLLLDPTYQRGDVWGETRRRNLIRSICLGIPIASIIVNDRLRHDQWNVPIGEPFIAVIDGKQRITTILMFMDSAFAVPGDWFGIEDGQQYLFCELPLGLQRAFRHIPLAFSEGSLPDLASEREVFELVNYGGVPQGETDL